MYVIDWSRNTEQDLAEIWLGAIDRNAVTDAVAAIDRLLALNPLHVGESRKSSVNRVMFYSPIYVEYDVIEDDKKVIVQGVGAKG